MLCYELLRRADRELINMKSCRNRQESQVIKEVEKLMALIPTDTLSGIHLLGLFELHRSTTRDSQLPIDHHGGRKAKTKDAQKITC
jgi:hypothetical protein